VTGTPSVAYLEERVAAAEIAISDHEFETLSAIAEQNACFRLRWRVLHGASQTVREQCGELCRILGYVAFSEKGCAVK
jgi:hypothetical protein